MMRRFTFFSVACIALVVLACVSCERLPLELYYDGTADVRITYDLYVHPDISEDQKTKDLMDRIFSDNS